MSQSWSPSKKLGFNNIRKFIRNILTCNSAEIWTILLVPVLSEVDSDFETGVKL